MTARWRGLLLFGGGLKVAPGEMLKDTRRGRNDSSVLVKRSNAPLVQRLRSEVMCCSASLCALSNVMRLSSTFRHYRELFFCFFVTPIYFSIRLNEAVFRIFHLVVLIRARAYVECYHSLVKLLLAAVNVCF